MDLMQLRRNLMMQMVKPQETYITNGLVLWLDGINRGGISGKWKNLVGDHIVTMTGLYTELSDGIEFPATSTPYGYGEFDSSTGIEINYVVIEATQHFDAPDDSELTLAVPIPRYNRSSIWDL